MTRRLLMAILSSPVASTIRPIVRNVAWNEIVDQYDGNNKTLTQIQNYYLAHDKEHELLTIDVNVIRLIDRCIDELNEIIRRLKKLKELR